MASIGECFSNLGQTYTVPEGSTFNQTNPQDYLVGNLNVAGTYNISGTGFFPHLYVNNIDISGTFNNNGGTVTASNGWYYTGLNITVTPTGQYNQSTGYLWHYVDSFQNQGTFQITGGSVNGITLLQNVGTLEFDDGYFYAQTLINNGTIKIDGGSFVTSTIINDGFINATQNSAFNDILNLDISNGVVTDITGKPGLILNYDATRAANTYLNNKDYLLSNGGLLTHFNDVVAATADNSYLFTTQETSTTGMISFDYWWGMGIQPPSYQQGYQFDVLALQGGTGWQYIGQIDAYNSSTEWGEASLLLPEDLRGPGTQIRFILNDYDPLTNPTVYMRNITTTPEPATMLLLGLGLVGLAGVRRKMQM